MDEFQKRLTQQILNFRKKRNWEQYHHAKDLAMCLSIESNELLELFLWKSEEQIDSKKLKLEIGDVFYSLLLLSHKFNINLEDAFKEKMKINQSKYPIDKFYGSNKKYNED
ncbi:MAG: nucleotide pyrophosphohydrolase [Flavobacteriaceae bacterium]|nr:nucleotide pyrophosphohydrolase [Flavobacteriaceae bacterium]MCY4268073.1 nucleotide pyrophosphohydrolase [Flavobacteriaceae bacterium]MCY4299214.1 nucleotide pyrophosphohydrolase [Flavobacteriaceae bacterium]